MNKLKAAMLTTKWANRYVKMKDSDIQNDIAYIQEKYSLDDEDYTKMMIGMQVLGTRAYVQSKFGDDSNV